MDPSEPHDDLLPTILSICEDFFAHTSPAVHRELDTLLKARAISGGPGWLIDMLALTRLRLQNADEPARTMAADQSAVKTRGD
ncbi:hypothetical protein GCM10010112_71300 [Actinoplanes lobatus]|uniref:Uncharacterized protein n=1 Tax=Actinoplanes lobatus TaxID=113568 RepID=A0A7W7HLX4_9ACTN|nr:hypothetical protein [Actinoplanes lobatus]MBB4752891.1 hypothetical protein [Actinoplanes lobatus]GGN88123.1 hypothetical protein GCM10010112_71300 [Actinoplanes lobatus]GIE39499.1 hypothetical protein Alo02nite_23970 [Actinoplanes lobatus]